MPENRLMYVGTILIVIAASIWLGAELTKRIEWTVPFVGGVGITLIVLSVGLELIKARRARAVRG